MEVFTIFLDLFKFPLRIHSALISLIIHMQSAFRELHQVSPRIPMLLGSYYLADAIDQPGVFKPEDKTLNCIFFLLENC